MKKIFDMAEIEIIVLSASDIITTSGEVDDGFPGLDDKIEY